MRNFMSMFVVVLMVLASSSSAAAMTFTVNSTGDGGDRDTSDDICHAGFITRGHRECTLRAAIQEANEEPGADEIHFDIGGTNTIKTIKPSSPLPTISDTVTIDGYTQPGASPNTRKRGTNADLRIQINGDGDGNHALRTTGHNNVIRGLVINRYGVGIMVWEGSGNRIEGNFIGTDPTGAIDRGNLYAGVSTDIGANIIGGETPAARNLISGNDYDGIHLTSSGNQVVGNLIGTDASGAAPLGNTNNGVMIYGDDNTIGGLTAASANVIAFNAPDFVLSLRAGIGIPAYPGYDFTGNRILRNSIFNNGGLGIDLGSSDGPGRTPNDADDGDTGPNNLQNFPVISSAETDGGTTVIEGNLNSTPSTTFTMRFFANPEGAPAEGRRFIGLQEVATGVDGTASFSFSPSAEIAIGERITATATDPNGNTSEFSRPRTVVAP